MTDPRTDRWQLPDGVDELLPEAAWAVETLRRGFGDLCRSWGFELVMPPLVEFVDSLLVGSGETLDLQTFKLIDQHSGRTLGVRADMTPQVARIDAHSLSGEACARLFYTGTVLRARADGAGGSRAPQQFGAELFGHAGVESDIEICRLMLETVRLAGVPAAQQVLDLGHVGVYRALVAEAGLAPEAERRVFEALGRGSIPDLEERLAESAAVVAVPAGSERAPATTAARAGAFERLRALSTLRGDESTIERARAVLVGAGEGVGTALDALARLVRAVRETHPEIALHVDLAELRGYAYHTGPLFAVHHRAGAQLARGGRYDHVGEAFGRARPASGFSGDLTGLADAGLAHAVPSGWGPGEADAPGAVRVDGRHAAAAWSEIRRLRAAGERVIVALPDTPPGALRCDRELLPEAGGWTLHPLPSR